MQRFSSTLRGHIALQAINAREIAPNDIVALTVGQIHGGNAGNVIPDTAFLSGTIRTYSNENREFIKQRVVEIAQGVAATFRATARVDYARGCPSVLNDVNLVKQVFRSAGELLGGDRVVDLTDLMGGAFARFPVSEDFAFISEKVPSVMVVLSAGSPQEGYQYPQHHPKAAFNEDTLYIGAALYADTALEWLKANTR